MHFGFSCPDTFFPQLAISFPRPDIRNLEMNVFFISSVAEEDPEYGPYVVGCGGYPNSVGVVEQDAAVMHGQNLDFGAVLAIQG